MVHQEKYSKRLYHLEQSQKSIKNQILLKTNTSRSFPPKATTAHNQQKVNYVRFEDWYDQINTMDNTRDDTCLIDSYAEYLKKDSEEEKICKDTNQNTITESEL